MPAPKIVIAALAALIALPVGRAALAQSGDARAEAQRKASAGAKLLTQGKAKDGLTLLEDAYRLHPDPRYQYNIGLAHQALKQEAEALVAFQRFIAEAQTRSIPEHIADAVAQEQALRKKLGELQLTCTHEGAAVTIDGRPRGETPAVSTLFLAPGAHTVRVTKDGFHPAEEQVELAAGKKKPLVVSLRPAAAAAIVPPPPEVLPPALSAPPSSALPAPEVAARAQADASPRATDGPFYTRWWFFTAVGAAVVAGVVTAVVIGSRSGGMDRCKTITCI